jgi:PTH1 family peptidyl-tRNA hydrolase
MHVLVGLGNPGPKYAGHRHNIGFMAVDAIARAYLFDAARRRFSGELAQGTIEQVKCLIVKPMTFMNESGRTVGECMRFYKLTPHDIYVFHDELDLAPGKIRFKTGGGVAGHNGLKSLARHIGPDFHRIRLGIGHPGDKKRVHGFVLRDFPKADKAWLEPLIDAVALHAPLLVADHPSSFINKVHLTLNPPPPKPDRPDKADKQQTQEQE